MPRFTLTYSFYLSEGAAGVAKYHEGRWSFIIFYRVLPRLVRLGVRNTSVSLAEMIVLTWIRIVIFWESSWFFLFLIYLYIYMLVISGVLIYIYIYVCVCVFVLHYYLVCFLTLKYIMWLNWFWWFYVLWINKHIHPRCICCEFIENVSICAFPIYREFMFCSFFKQCLFTKQINKHLQGELRVLILVYIMF